MKEFAKNMINGLATVMVLPPWIVYWVKSFLMGRERACASAGQGASKWTGVTGEYLRRRLLKFIVARIGKDVVISFGSILTKPSIEIADGVYIGSYCLLGDVRIGKNTLIADQVCIPSGSGQHGIRRLDLPIRDQEGEFRTVRIGEDCWIGSSAVVLADVGNHCVVGAGSVVTRPVDDYQIVAGNPAKVIGNRRSL
jgi:acetyltransferase-like isoleucine patch superfamily enzyme